MRIRLSDERKSEIAKSIASYFQAEFDETLSAFQAELLVDFMLKQIGPSQYNQAIADARQFFAQRLDDLDTEFYEPEDKG